MDVREGETVEFKREMNSSAVKTVIAFANTGGGTLYIGVDDEGVYPSAASVRARS